MPLHLATNSMIQFVLDASSKASLRRLAISNGFSNDHLVDDEWADHVTCFHPVSCPKSSPYAGMDSETAGVAHPVGRVSTSVVDTMVVVLNFPNPGIWIAHQGGGLRLLHITLGCSAGTRPAASNEAIAVGPIVPFLESMPLAGVLRVVARKVR